jgi:hypothetical protein
LSLTGLSTNAQYTIWVNVSDVYPPTHYKENDTVSTVYYVFYFNTYNATQVTTNTDLIDFYGYEGENVWCNSTGDYNETLEIIMDLNETAGIYEVCVGIHDLNSSGIDTIDNVHICMFVSVDNTTWRNISFFTATDVIKLNSTSWTWADDPFTYNLGGLLTIHSDDTIYVRFKLYIPQLVEEDLYCDLSAYVTAYSRFP